MRTVEPEIKPAPSRSRKSSAPVAALACAILLAALGKRGHSISPAGVRGVAASRPGDLEEAAQNAGGQRYAGRPGPDRKQARSPRAGQDRVGARRVRERLHGPDSTPASSRLPNGLRVHRAYLIEAAAVAGEAQLLANQLVTAAADEFRDNAGTR